MNEITNYLDSKSISYRLSGNEAILRCNNCGKEKLYLNTESGTYHCFVCEVNDPTSLYAKGHISQLKEEWGDIVPIAPASASFQSHSSNQKEVNLIDEVTLYHNSILDDSLLALKAYRYLFNRGITMETIKRFKLGTCNKYNQDWISIPCFEDGIPKLIKYKLEYEKIKGDQYKIQQVY